jgi:uncharacterized protein YndB with AHSA1/START domain
MAAPVVHRTFSIERTYPESPERVFAAFADPDLDIVPDDRIVFAYSLISNETRISASLATVALTAARGGTRWARSSTGLGRCAASASWGL